MELGFTMHGRNSADEEDNARHSCGKESNGSDCEAEVDEDIGGVVDNGAQVHVYHNLSTCH